MTGLRLLVPALLVLAVAGSGWTAPDDEDANGHVRWLTDLNEAYAEARARAVPLLLAIHYRSDAPDASWPADAAAWNAVYAAPEVVRLSRSVVCVQQLRRSPPEGGDPSPIHLLLGPDGRRIDGVARWESAPGRDSVEALLRLLGEAATAALEERTSAPAASGGPVRPAPGERTAPLERLTLPPTATGVRVHVGFAGRVPELPDGVDAIRARVLASWDQGTQAEVDTLTLRPGERADDHPVDVEFAAIRASEEPPELGAHRVDLWIHPAQGAYDFTQGADPLYLGVVYVDIQEGDGGGGGGGGADTPQPQPQPQPEPEEPPPPPPAPGPDESEPPPPPPDEGRVEVVDPLVRHDRDRVQKEEAVVAVPDPEAGLEPPPLVPLEDAMREFQRVVERAMGSERIRPADRAFLLRYFRALSGRTLGGGADGGSDGGR